MKFIEAKIVILGAQGVGKTSVAIRYVGNTFSKHVSPTIGASFFTCKLAIDDFHVKLQVWDTAGQERFRAMAPMYYRGANAAFVVFDMTSYQTFLMMKSWVDELKRNVEETVVMCILANKCDLASEREVKTNEAMEYASLIGASYYETSAVTNEGIEEAFLQVAKDLITISVEEDTDIRVSSTTDGPFSPRMVRVNLNRSQNGGREIVSAARYDPCC